MIFRSKLGSWFKLFILKCSIYVCLLPNAIQMVDIWSIIKSGAIEVLIALLNLSRTFQGVDFTNASFMSFRSLQNIYSREYNLCVAYIIYIYKCNTQIYITEGQKHHIYTYIFIYQTYHLPGHSFIYFFILFSKNYWTTSNYYTTKTRNRRMGSQNMVPALSARVSVLTFADKVV